MGLTIAIEEVAKYSNTAVHVALDPVADRPRAHRRKRGTKAPLSSPDRRWVPAGLFGLSDPQPGSDVMGMRTRGVPDPERAGGWVLERHQVLDVRGAEADWYTVFAKTGEPTSRAHDSITAFIVERGWDGVAVGARTTRWGCGGRHGKLVLTGSRFRRPT